MSVNIVKFPIANSKIPFESDKVQTDSKSAQGSKHQKKEKHKEIPAPTKVKVGVLLTTLASVGTTLAFILKKRGYGYNPLKAFKTPIKDWSIFKAIYKDGNNPKDENAIELMVIKLAFASVFGGLAGGAIFDKKENFKAKVRESIIQLVGNIFTPLACVSLGMKGFKLIEDKLVAKLPTHSNPKIAKIIKGTPGVIASGICLLSGIILGNKVGNLINEKVFKVKDNRKLKLADMSPHIDDLCLAVSLVAAENHAITRVIPAALMVAGYSTGVMQERPERLAHPDKSAT